MTDTRSLSEVNLCDRRMLLPATHGKICAANETVGEKFCRKRDRVEGGAGWL